LRARGDEDETAGWHAASRRQKPLAPADTFRPRMQQAYAIDYSRPAASPGLVCLAR
jgi:hypothetical protein